MRTYENKPLTSTAHIAVILILFLLLAACRVPTRFVRGVYKNNNGDTLKLKDDMNFRVEVLEPDTAVLKQFKITTGRWYRKRNKVWLHVDAVSMGEYWECVPMRISFNHLRRPVECSGKGDGMVFRKVHPKKKKSRDKNNRDETDHGKEKKSRKKDR
jgi:hypothetical protein